MPIKPEGPESRTAHYQVGDIRSYLFNNITFYCAFLQSPHSRLPPASRRLCFRTGCPGKANPAGTKTASARIPPFRPYRLFLSDTAHQILLGAHTPAGVLAPVPTGIRGRLKMCLPCEGDGLSLRGHGASAFYRAQGWPAPITTRILAKATAPTTQGAVCPYPGVDTVPLPGKPPSVRVLIAPQRLRHFPVRTDFPYRIADAVMGVSPNPRSYRPFPQGIQTVFLRLPPSSAHSRLSSSGA